MSASSERPEPAGQPAESRAADASAPDRPTPDQPETGAHHTDPLEPLARATATLPAGVALHARPAAELVRAASQLPGSVTLAANGKRANAKSILEVLALGATGGTELTIEATGPDGALAAATLAAHLATLGT